ncbi:chemosensory receptor C [Elysia marginata]|uniref:Chemosensory receptor C n=1 Tax=Elysia marginata TaxID=1093978 RepID=A0AAV4IW08_9GAST|nr:chemosensory receptor C [Elysia marginata]
MFMFAINYPLYVSLVVTTVIAIVRCLCVVSPLSFRSMVTHRRQLLVIATVSCFAVAIPAYTQVIVITFSGRVNSSQEQYASNEQMALLDIFMNTFSYGCLSIIIVSMIFLVFALKKSSRFQALAKSTARSDKQSKAAIAGRLRLSKQ